MASKLWKLETPTPWNNYEGSFEVHLDLVVKFGEEVQKKVTSLYPSSFRHPHNKCYPRTPCFNINYKLLYNLIKITLFFKIKSVKYSFNVDPRITIKKSMIMYFIVRA